MQIAFEVGGGVLLTANTLMLLKLTYQAGKLVQKVDDHERALDRHDEEIRELRAKA